MKSGGREGVMKRNCKPSAEGGDLKGEGEGGLIKQGQIGKESANGRKKRGGGRALKRG